MGKKGQTSVEVISIAVVLAALLLLVLITTYGKNSQTGQLKEINENSIQCNEISATVGRLYSNRATTKATLSLAEDAILRRKTERAGRIDVGEISCWYIGGVQKSTGEKDSDEPNGMSLSSGKWCFEKSDSEIIASEGECS